MRSIISTIAWGPALSSFQDTPHEKTSSKRGFCKEPKPRGGPLGQAMPSWTQRCVNQRVQDVPSAIPIMAFGPHTTVLGYLDPLGHFQGLWAMFCVLFSSRFEILQNHAPPTDFPSHLQVMRFWFESIPLLTEAPASELAWSCCSRSMCEDCREFLY